MRASNVLVFAPKWPIYLETSTMIFVYRTLRVFWRPHEAGPSVFLAVREDTLTSYLWNASNKCDFESTLKKKHLALNIAVLIDVIVNLSSLYTIKAVSSDLYWGRNWHEKSNWRHNVTVVLIQWKINCFIGQGLDSTYYSHYYLGEPPHLGSFLNRRTGLPHWLQPLFKLRPSTFS